MIVFLGMLAIGRGRSCIIELCFLGMGTVMYHIEIASLGILNRVTAIREKQRKVTNWLRRPVAYHEREVLEIFLDLRFCIGFAFRFLNVFIGLVWGVKKARVSLKVQS